jgi:hypothetical protein
MRRDVDRAQMPGGSVWNLLDFIPDELGVPLAGRGGWTYSGSSMSGATSFKSLSYAPFSGGAKILGVSQEPKLWDVVGASSISGTPTIPGGPPAFHRGKLIIPNNDGTTAVTYYDGSTLGNLAGSPPAGMLAAVYKDHAILAKSSANKNRVWFSGAGDPTSWDTTLGYWDTTNDVVAVAPLLNAILIMHGDTVERLRGTIPPPGSDMVLEPFLDYGCLDPFSVANWRNRVVFCSSEGIHMTDGATDLDLTASAEMKTYWQATMAGYTSSWRIAGGVYRDHYIVSINNGSSLIDCFCVDLLRRTMWRFTNLHGNAFVQVTTSAQEELYMAQANAGRVGKLSSLWSPSSSVKNDADGTTPTPIMETPALRGYDRLHRRWIQSMGKQKWRFSYLDYDLRDSASDNPTMTLSYGKSPTGSYTAATPTFPATTDQDRKRVSLSGTHGGAQRSQMLTLKVAVTGPYAAAKIYAVEGSYEPIDIGQL